MAKGLRSKHKRAMRAIKRERYAVKELKRLKDMLGIKDGATSNDVEMAVGDLATVRKNIVESQNTNEEKVDDTDHANLRNQPASNCSFSENPKDVFSSDESEDSSHKSQCEKPIETEMEHSQKRMYNRKTFKDQFGNYPSWLSRNDLKKIKNKNNLRKKEELKIRKRVAKKIQKKKESGVERVFKECVVTES